MASVFFFGLFFGFSNSNSRFGEKVVKQQR